MSPTLRVTSLSLSSTKRDRRTLDNTFEARGINLVFAMGGL
jgi:hypothetical protein